MTCKDCIHYEACKFLIDFINRTNRKLSTLTSITVDEFTFPMDDKYGKICDNQAPRDRYIELPCKVGDTVYCDISNVRDGNFLDECIIQSIEFDRDFHEPLFTAICREKAEYQTYWTSDFGKTIFHEPHFAADKKRKKGKK